MLIFYFAGHGQVLGNSGHLVTVDGKFYDPGISLAQLGQLMEEASLRYDHVIAILDCCHSGSAFNWVNSRPLSPRDVEREVATVNESRCILAACRPEQYSYPNNASTNGVFTDRLLDGLIDKAVDFDGRVTLLNLFEYITRTMPEGLQTPVFKGDVAGTVVLGEGFEPRKGRPLETREINTNIAKAQKLIDEYQNLQQRELSDPAHRLSEGARVCASQLEGVITWFKETETELQDIQRDAIWRQFGERLKGFRSALSEIAVGQETQFGRVVSHIGHGGYGHVWEIETPEGGRLAYKVFHGNELDQDLKVRRFDNGYRNMKKLEGHPNIVRVFEMTAAPLGFLMDAIPGSDLRHAFIRREDAEHVIRLLIDVTDTVRTAHGSGVKHRDIKPENIIVTSDDESHLKPWLTDFDLAYHETNRTLTTNLGVGGVINYAAPEQLHSPNTAAARAEAVDIFSLAQLLFFVIVGRDPSGDNFADNLTRLRNTLNSWVEDRAAVVLLGVYESCTSRTPSERLSMLELIEKLSQAEAFILQASGDDSVSESQLCRKVGHLYAGLGRYDATDDRVSMQSLSGQVSVIHRLKDVGQKGKAIIEIEFNVTERITVPAFKSGGTARTAINAKLDKALRRWRDVVTRHDGKKGQYQVFVHVKDVSLDLAGVTLLRDITQTVVAGIEQW